MDALTPLLPLLGRATVETLTMVLLTLLFGGLGGLVMGLPLNMDGSEGPRVQATRSFVRNMKPLLPLPVLFCDERLSTAAVTRALIAADASRAKCGEVVDMLAAAYILQGCLDQIRGLLGDEEREERDAY
jgi:putative Holliday junction resolvase